MNAEEQPDLPSPDARGWRGEAAGMSRALPPDVVFGTARHSMPEADPPDQPKNNALTVRPRPSLNTQPAPMPDLHDTFPLWPVPASPVPDAEPTVLPPDAPAPAATTGAAAPRGVTYRVVTSRERASTAIWPSPELRVGRPPRAGIPAQPARASTPERRRRNRPQRRPAVGLALTLVLALLATFFSWVSAEPFWLAVGHAVPGTATVTGCTGNGVGQRCLATFEGGTFTTRKVTLVGVAGRPGASYRARMVAPTARIAYSGDHDALYVRWTVGLVFVVLCGLAIAWATGARRLGTARARRAAIASSMAAPLLLFLGMLAATW